MVRDTYHLRCDIAYWNNFYCDKLGIKNDHDLIVGRQEIKEHIKNNGIWYLDAKEELKNREWFEKDYNAICLNVTHKDNKKRSNVEYMIIHELIHKKYPDLKH
jgi:hypothetical protein